MASRFRPSAAGRTMSTQTIEVQHSGAERLSSVDPGIAKTIHALPNVTEKLQNPEDVFPKSQRSSNQKVEGNTPQQNDDHDPKYNIDFKLIGFPNVHNYVRRRKQLDVLTAFIGQQPADVRKTVFLVGKSGFGKTQLATTYAQESKNKIHSATFFIDATTKSTLTQSFASILRDQLWEKWPKELNKPETQPSGNQSVRSLFDRNLVRHWLSQPRNTRWLLIFDNASDPDLLIPYLPPLWVDHGTVIITTQHSSFTSEDFLEKNVPGQSREIDIEGLNDEEGKQLLVDIAGDAYQEVDTVTRVILKNLEWCPCKIVQFAKDVKQEKGVHPVYRGIIERTVTGQANTEDGDQLFNIACTRLLNDLGSGSVWNREAHQDARKLLLLFTFLHPQDIWYGLVRKGQVDPGPPGGDHWLRRSTHSPLDFKERVKILIDRGFIAVDSVEDIESARITIHDRLQNFLLREQSELRENKEVFRLKESKEILRFAASCVAYSNCGDYHPEQYEIRTRLMPHVHAIRQHLEAHNEFGLRQFHFDDLEPRDQVVVRQMTRDEKDLMDQYIGFLNPFSDLAYLLAWDIKYSEALIFVENAYKFLSPTMSQDVATRWTVLIAHLLYFDENPDNYKRARGYTKDAIDFFAKSERDIRVFYFAKRLQIALNTRWGSSEDKATALKDNEDVVSQIRSALPNSVYYMETLNDSASILLEGRLFDRLAQRCLETFRCFQEKLPISHRMFVILAAKSAINTSAEVDTYLKTAISDEDKAAERRLITRKAWEGFKKCLGEEHARTITQARNLAWLYDEEKNLDECISIRRWIIAALDRVSDSDSIERARDCKLLAEVLWKKNSTLQEDDDTLFEDIKESVDKGLNLIQLAQVEKDEKILALQFGMADILCEIHEYSAALPLLKQILACLKAIEGHSQRNVNAVLGQLCTVYYKESKTPELATLLEEWAVPDIQLDDPSLALETWRKKARACMNYSFHGKAIPLLERIQSYLTAQPEPQQAEILENRYQLAECLELTNQFAEAVDMYNSIIDSTSGNSTFNTPDRLLRSRVFQGLGDIYREKSERPLAISMFEKALEEVKACEDKQSNDVRWYEAKAIYEIAKIEWETYILDNPDPAISTRAAKRFEEVLTFQDSNGRLILSDQQIGWTFYFLGYFDIVNDRTADAQQRLRKSLAYYVKERPPVIWAIQPTYHLLFRSLWEQINNPETDKLTEIFWIMLGILASIGIFNSLPNDFADFSIAGLLASSWVLPENISADAVDLALEIISELVSILGLMNSILPLAHITSLKLLRICESKFGAGDWRSRNVLCLLEDIERTQSDEADNPPALFVSKAGYLSVELGDKQREVWSDPGPRPPTDPDEPLSDDTSKILVRLEKWQSAPAQLKAELKDRLVYNPPPETSGWPQSWTFMPNLARLKEEKLDIPLRIANAPVVIPAPKSYPTVWSSIPPKDSHAPIDPSEPLDVKTIVDIFREYTFAHGFLLLNRRLQIVVEDDFDYSAAFAEKPIVYGGLKVDYVRNTLLHTSEPENRPVLTNSAHSTLPRLQINSTVVATRFKRPVMGLFGRPVEVSAPRIARIGVRIRPKHGRERDKHLVTIPTHCFKDAAGQTKKPSRFLSSLRRLSEKRGFRVKVFEETTRRQIGTITESFEESSGSYALGRVLAPDISLVAPLRPEYIATIESPVQDLDWISEGDWKLLKRKAHQSLKMLGVDEIQVSGIRTGVTGRQSDCTIIGEGVFRTNFRRSVDTSQTGHVERLNEITLGIKRCLLFRVQDWSSLKTPGSGIAVYTTFSGSKNPALVGFVSFKQPPYDPNDEGSHQEKFDGQNMNDDEFSKEIRDGNVAFFGAWKLLPKLSENYEIVCVQQTSPAEQQQSQRQI